MGGSREDGRPQVPGGGTGLCRWSQGVSQAVGLRPHATLILVGDMHINNLVYNTALAGVALWLERWPAGQKVTGAILGQGHLPGLQV